MKLLKDIAEIRSGFPFRERPVRVETGGCRLVQMRNVNRIVGAVGGDLETVKEPANWQNQRLRRWDILFTARGQQNNAAVFDLEMPNAIAASTLHVLRVKEGVDPFYLVWYLNLPQTKERLRTMQAGSSIPFISIDDLGQLPVRVPSMELQGRIFDLVSLGQEEQALMELLRRKRRALIEGMLQTLMNKAK
jgi:restriction endonuclease S subunit